MEIARHWRLKKQRYLLQGDIDEYGRVAFPSGPHRPRFNPKNGDHIEINPDSDNSIRLKPFLFSGTGTIYSVATVTDAPAGYGEQAPYRIAIVKFDEGPMVTTAMTDLDQEEELSIGQRVEMVTRIGREEGKTGTIHYQYKFRAPIKTS